MQQKSLALGYTVACMSSSLGYTLGTLPLYHTIYPGARDLPYRKKNCCFIPKSENRDILCTQEDLGWEEGFCVGGGKEGQKWNWIERVVGRVIMLQSTYKCTIHWMNHKQSY